MHCDDDNRIYRDSMCCYSSIPLDDLRPTMMCDLKDQGASVLTAEDVVFVLLTTDRH
ncbi:hypothetical protein XF_2565 [Xylella fastidiosa 9a5c]|uniref:Uncharacterized protein n=1 Tax=Xylella fastidiosa (strain 9a5c) TaxID=160492 RepID=Q9PAF3_XYLFA|nr:hypothetical protein XF_2565 [Xylella fastidiosa 9a5c]